LQRQWERLRICPMSGSLCSEIFALRSCRFPAETISSRVQSVERSGVTLCSAMGIVKDQINRITIAISGAAAGSFTRIDVGRFVRVGRSHGPARESSRGWRVAGPAGRSVLILRSSPAECLPDCLLSAASAKLFSSYGRCALDRTLGLP
jgi:hypothetical protein